MKKLIFTTTLAVSLALGTSASANTEASDTAGTTPDQFLYTLDHFFEDLKLAITFDSEEEAALLLQFAQERLAEAELMSEEEKSKFVSEAIEMYASLLEDAQEAVTEVVEDEQIDEETKEELSDQLEEVTEIDDEVADELDEEQTEELVKKIDEAYLVANVVMGFDVEVVKTLREQEFGYGEIAKIISLAELSGKSIEEITALLSDKEIGEVMKELEITISQVKELAVSKKIASLEESLIAARESGNEKAVKKLEKKLGSLINKKEKLAVKTEDEEQPEVEVEESDSTESETIGTETEIETETDAEESQTDAAVVPASTNAKTAAQATSGLATANAAKTKAAEAARQAQEQAKKAQEKANEEAKKAAEVAKKAQEQAKKAQEKANEEAKKAAEKAKEESEKDEDEDEDEDEDDEKENDKEHKGKDGK